MAGSVRVLLMTRISIPDVDEAYPNTSPDVIALAISRALQTDDFKEALDTFLVDGTDGGYTGEIEVESYMSWDFPPEDDADDDSENETEEATDEPLQDEDD